MTITLQPEPLTKERFAPYGDVIESVVDRKAAMNAARFERFDDLCSIDMKDDGRVAILRVIRGAGHGSGRKDDMKGWLADELAFASAMTEVGRPESL